MRVLQVHKDFQPLKGGGGTARHIHGLARALAPLGCDIRVVAPDAETVSGPYATQVAGRAELPAHVAWADVIHVHGARSTYCLAGGIAAWRAGKPFFYTPHAYYRGESAANNAAKWLWDRTAEAFLAGRSAATILLTPVWRDFYRQNGIPRDRTVIIPNCVIHADLGILPRGKGDRLAGSPAILSVGRLDPVKRNVDVIHALAADPTLAHAHFHVVGKGDDRPALEALARELGVADRVIFHGFVDDGGVARMAAVADVFVLASEQEGLPTALLEALLARLPVVCTDIPGNRAIIDAAGIETHYPVGDIAALARLLAAAPAMGVTDAAADAIANAFTWEQRAQEILDLYAAALPVRRAAA